MSALSETETKTCHTLVLPARPITPWSHKQDQEQLGSDTGLERLSA